MRNRTRSLLALLLGSSGAVALALAQCSTPEGGSQVSGSGAHAQVSLAAWDVVYGVLQHPRCLNCHPVGNVPLQGDAMQLHAQNVQRGRDGKGLYAMRCATCHSTQNVAGAHMPPGAPNWHLPSAQMPLVFEGVSSADLCRQLQDPLRNGGKTREQILHHLAEDPLVLWGWSPGDGRTPVSTPHADLVLAARAWVDGGCACPE